MCELTAWLGGVPDSLSRSEHRTSRAWAASTVSVFSDSETCDAALRPIKPVQPWPNPSFACAAPPTLHRTVDNHRATGGLGAGPPSASVAQWHSNPM